MSTDYHHPGFTLLTLWGLGPARIDSLIDQLADPDQDYRRIMTAMEWYLRIVNGVDPLISAINFPMARKELTMRYRDGLKLDQIANIAGYEYSNMQRRINTYADAIARLLPDYLIRLVAWRLELHNHWRKSAVIREIRGFEIEGYELLPIHMKKREENGQIWQEINPSEIEKLMHDPGYEIDIDRLAAGPVYIDGVRSWNNESKTRGD